MKINKSLNEYLSGIYQKLNDEVKVHALQFGTVSDIPGQSMVRDAQGLQMTISDTITRAATNFFFATQGNDAIANSVEMAFSEYGTGTHNTPSIGYENVSGVKTVGAIDVDVMSLSQSLIPFVAVDRGMDDPVDTVYFMDLISSSADGVGGVANGETVAGNFEPVNPKNELGPDGHNADEIVVQGGKADYAPSTPVNLIPGTVAVQVTVNNGTVDQVFEGHDYQSNGVIMFPPEAGITAASVDYDTGAISVTGDADKFTACNVAFKKDVSADELGRNVLTVQAKWVPTQLEAVPQNIVLKSDIHNRLYMQKINARANGTGGASMAELEVGKTKNVYIEYQNKLVFKEIIKGFSWADGSSDITLPLAEYDVSKFAETKNDLVKQVVINLAEAFRGRTGMAPTCILTGTMGTACLSGIKDLWVANPESKNGVNGLAGYFNGIAVYRHVFMDTLGGTDGKLYFYTLAKLPDNGSGSIVYGEYLPMTSTGTVSNYFLPTNISNGFFSQAGARKIQDRLVMRAEIIPPTWNASKNVLYPNMARK